MPYPRPLGEREGKKKCPYAHFADVETEVQSSYVNSQKSNSWVVVIWSLSRVWLFATPWTVAHQAPLSMGFSRQEYWSGLPFPSPKQLGEELKQNPDPQDFQAELSISSSQSVSQLSRSVVSDSLQPHESQHTRPPCPSPTPGLYSNSCPSSWWCYPANSSSVVPFSSCPRSLPASGSFPMSQLFAWGGQSTGASASASAIVGTFKHNRLDSVLETYWEPSENHNWDYKEVSLLKETSKFHFIVYIYVVRFSSDRSYISQDSIDKKNQWEVYT